MHVTAASLKHHIANICSPPHTHTSPSLLLSRAQTLVAHGCQKPKLMAMRWNVQDKPTQLHHLAVAVIEKYAETWYIVRFSE